MLRLSLLLLLVLSSLVPSLHSLQLAGNSLHTRSSSRHICRIGSSRNALPRPFLQNMKMDNSDTTESTTTSKAKKPWFNAKMAIASLCVFSATAFGSFGGSQGAFVANAADTVAVGKCLLTSCQKELAQCVLNPKCFANIICLNTCNDRKDEAEVCDTCIVYLLSYFDAMHSSIGM